MRLATPLFAVLGALVSLAGPVAAGTVPGSRDYQARQKEGIRLLDGIYKSLPESLWLDRLTVSPQQILIEGKALNTKISSRTWTGCRASRSRHCEMRARSLVGSTATL